MHLLKVHFIFITTSNVLPILSVSVSTNRQPKILWATTWLTRCLYFFLSVYIWYLLRRGVALVFNASSPQCIPTARGEQTGVKAVSQVRSGVGCARRDVFIKQPWRDVRYVFVFIFCFFVFHFVFPEPKQFRQSESGSSACRTGLMCGFLVSK